MKAEEYFEEYFNVIEFEKQDKFDLSFSKDMMLMFADSFAQSQLKERDDLLERCYEAVKHTTKDRSLLDELDNLKN